MKNRTRSLGVVVALSLMLSACGSGGTPTPSPTPTSTPTVEKVATITLALDFPGANEISALAVPSSAAQAQVKVFQGTSLLSTLTIVKGQTTPTTIQLAQGQTYRFETSVQSAASTEVAWGVTDYTVSTDGQVALQVRSIVGSTTLATGPASGDRQDVLLTVLDATGASLLSDFDVTYQVEGGQLVEQNKIGAVVQLGSGADTTVTSTVTGLATDHTVQTFTTKTVLSRAVTVDYTLNGQFSGWPTTPQLSGRFVNSSNNGLSITGNVQTDGSFVMNFPNVSSIISTTVPFGGNSSVAGAQFAYFPAPSVEMNGVIVATPPYISSPTQAGLMGFIYSDRDTVVSWSNLQCGRVGCTSGSQGRLDLKKGWNYVLRAPYSGLTDTYTSSPIGQSITLTPSIINVVDFGVTLNSSQLQTYPDEVVTYTANFVKPTPSGTPSLYASKFRIELPKGLEWLNDVTNATCEAPVVQGEKTIISCNTTSSDSVTFKAKALSLEVDPVNPTSVSIEITNSGIYDSNPANNSAQFALTRLANSSLPQNVILDLNTPELTLNALTAATVGTPTAITGTAKDNVGVDKIEAYSGARLVGTAQPDTAGAWSVNWTPSRRGGEVVRAVAYDRSGNATLKSFTVDVK